MKFFLLIILLTTMRLLGSAQEELELSDTTEFGKPIGEPVTVDIGEDGGTIISSDKKVKLIFPPGALSASTKITIQVTTNNAPNGFGSAYDFQPSGLIFKKPVAYFYYYSKQEEEQCPPDIMGLAVQNQKGVWSYMDFENWDSAGGYLLGKIQHFSGYTPVSKLCIYPVHSEMVVGESRILIVTNIATRFQGRAAPIITDVFVDPKHKFIWTVNSKENGDDEVGTIETLREFEHANQRTVRYAAPAKIPKNGTVLVAARIMLERTKKGKKEKVSKTIACSINIIDLYAVKFVSHFIATCEDTFIDSATFDMKITRSGLTLDHIKNYPPKVEVENNCIRGCKIQYLIDASSYGSIHITQPKASNVYFGDETNAHIEFEPNDLMVAFEMRVKCAHTPARTSQVQTRSVPEIIDLKIDGKSYVQSVLGVDFKIFVRPIGRKNLR